MPHRVRRSAPSFHDQNKNSVSLPPHNFTQLMQFEPPKVIFIDVDGTLQKGGEVDPAVVAWCQAKHAAGFQLVLWSSAGEAHALRFAELSGIRPLFAHVISKPGLILDDKAWQWTFYTRALASVDDDLFYEPPTSLFETLLDIAAPGARLT